jgi:gas vesicle protein
MKASTFFALMGGLAAGVVLGMMFAPDNGEENRKKFRSKVDEFREKYCNENAEGAAAEAAAGEAEAPANE